MSRKVKMLFIIDYFHRTGGTEKHLSQLVPRLPSDVFDCIVVVFDLGENPLIDGMRDAGIRVIHLPVGREYTPAAIMRARELLKLIKENSIEIVQSFHQKSDSFGALVARLAGVKHIISSRRDIAHNRKPRHIFLNRRLRFLFEKVIVVSDAVGVVVSEKEGVDRRKIEKIYNGVDSVMFSPPSREETIRERARLGIGRDDFVVGMVAGFRPEKNIDVLLQGAAKAMKAVPSIKVLAVGGGPLLAHFRSLSNDCGLRKNVIFTGEVADVVPYLKAMDIGCLLSEYEGFSNSVLESMSSGLPMIVTNVGGNSEAVFHQRNGLLVAPRDVDGFCAALFDLYSNPEKRREMGRRSRQLVVDNFTLDQMCKKHVALYLSLLRYRESGGD